MYNKTILVGNLTRDIELRYLPTGSALAKTAIATSYKYKAQNGEQKEEVCFLDLTFFGRPAEIANQFLRKGSKVLAEGRLILEQWSAQDGTSRSKHSLRVDEMKMLDSRPQQSQNQGSYPEHQYTTERQSSNPNGNKIDPRKQQYQEERIPVYDADTGDEILF